MHAFWNTLTRPYLSRFLLATLAYGASYYLGFLLLPAAPQQGTLAVSMTLIWPAAAASVIILWFWGMEMWPAISLAVLGILLFVRDATPPFAVTAALLNALEALIVVYLLRYRLGFSPMFSRLRDSLSFLAVAFLSSALFASLTILSSFLFTGAPLTTTRLTTVWIVHFVSMIAFAPFFIRWLHRPVFSKSPEEVIEGVALFGSIFTLCFLMFWTPYSSVGNISLIYILILPLVWAALRTGPRGITLAIAILTLCAYTGIFLGYGPITHSAFISQALFQVQIIIGTLTIIFLLFTSITEERREAVLTLEAHVDRLQSALQKISSEDQAKTDFIAILAHELRNPLSPILSGLELLKQEEKADMEVLQMMGAHLNTAARLLDDLLDISRISQKKFKLQREQVAVRDIVNRTLEMVTPHMEARDHTFAVTLPEEDIRFLGDPVRLAQIFVNLLNNAAKYTDPGGSISFTVTREGTQLVATVKDNGIGIPEHRLQKVFEPFGGGETGGHRPGGLRIGLSLAKRMAEMHQGNITAVSSGEGRGSTFTVRLPLTKTMQLPLPQSTSARVRGRFSKQLMDETRAKLGPIRILIVDDNEAAADGLKKLLAHQGHQVEAVYDGPQALDAAEQLRPDVAILDIGLPSMSGYELAEKMRARFGKGITLVALTGYGQSDDKQKAHASGFDEHLVKPVSVSDVQRVLVELRARD